MFSTKSKTRITFTPNNRRRDRDFQGRRKFSFGDKEPRFRFPNATNSVSPAVGN